MNIKIILLSFLLGSCTTVTLSKTIPVLSVYKPTKLVLNPITQKYVQKYARGTAFKMKYKGKTFILSAGHVCQGDSTVILDGVVRKVLYTIDDDNLDYCVIEAEDEKRLTTFYPALLKTKTMKKVTTIGLPGIYRNHPVKLEGYIIVSQEYPTKNGNTIGIIRHTSRIFSGHSGGPLFYRERIIGVVVATERQTRYGLSLNILTIIKDMESRGLYE